MYAAPERIRRRSTRRSGAGIFPRRRLQLESDVAKGKGQTEIAHQQRSPMTERSIAEVKTWFARISDHAARAIELAGQMSRQEMVESDCRFWALAKFAENVQESIIKLDTLNPNICPMLVEISADTWKGFKGMRQRLVHQFWNIDPDILRETVLNDFPQLQLLLNRIVVNEKFSVSPEQRISFTLTFDQLNAVPSLTKQGTPYRGDMLIHMSFGRDGRIDTCRVGHLRHDKIVAISGTHFLVTDWKGNR